MEWGVAYPQRGLLEIWKEVMGQGNVPSDEERPAGQGVPFRSVGTGPVEGSLSYQSSLPPFFGAGKVRWLGLPQQREVSL